MFVCLVDFEDWQEEQTILDFENEFTRALDFEAWEEELLSPTRAGQAMRWPPRP